MAELGIAASVVQIVGLGTKLSFSFYKLASTVSSATTDLSRVAKGVNLFCLMLKQMGLALKEDRTQEPIHSAEALETVQEIIQQCGGVFDELQSMLKKCGWEGDDMELSRLQKIRWTVKKPRIEYVLAHLDSLKLTLAVMMQTLQTARIADISRRMSASSAASTNFDDAETVTSQKTQLESLVVDQQLSLYKATELYGECQTSERADTSDEKSLVPANEKLASIVTEMKSAGLELYQERSLEKVYTSATESERVALVLKIASPLAEKLLKQWTVIDRPPSYYESRDSLAVQSPHGKTKPSLRRIASQPEPQKPVNLRSAHLNTEPSLYQNPSVESDSEDETQSSKFGTQSTIFELDNDPNAFLRAPNSFNPTTKNFPSATREYPPNAAVSRTATSPTSPVQPQQPQIPHPKASFQDRPQAHRIFSANDADPLYRKSAHNGERDNLGIPWRIRLRGYYWDFVDGNLSNTNMPNPGAEIFSDPQVRTEVSSSWICREAIEARSYPYTTFRVDGQKGSDGAMYYSIQRPLDLPDIKDMVDQTAQIYRQRRVSGSQPTSPQNNPPPWQPSPPGRRGTGNAPAPAPAVRSPEPAPGPQLFRYSSSTNTPRSPSQQTLSPEFYQPGSGIAPVGQPPRIQVSSGRSARRVSHGDGSDDGGYDDGSGRRKDRARGGRKNASDRSKSRSGEKDPLRKSMTGLGSSTAARNAGKLGTIFGLAALLDELAI
ncbi:MAG: hypothetical protein M1821_001013 [Bathelium mastoideum]|nr:MAG: hypothetical protein M1821_001013 [Bathelium mastoideum]